MMHDENDENDEHCPPHLAPSFVVVDSCMRRGQGVKKKILVAAKRACRIFSLTKKILNGKDPKTNECRHASRDL